MGDVPNNAYKSRVFGVVYIYNNLSILHPRPLPLVFFLVPISEQIHAHPQVVFANGSESRRI
jgi:hypothetical protein